MDEIYHRAENDVKEKMAEDSGFFPTIWRDTKDFARGLGQPGGLQVTEHAGPKPVASPSDRSLPYQAVSAIGTGLGMAEPGPMESAAAAGHPREVLGHAAFQAARGILPLAAGHLAPAIETERPAIANLTREPLPSKISTAAEGPQWERTISGKIGEASAGKVGYKVDPSGHAQVFGSVVDPKLRGQGIGTELYRNMIEDARAGGAKSIGSDPTNTTPGALRVWEKLGAEKITHPNGKPGYRLDLGRLK